MALKPSLYLRLKGSGVETFADVTGKTEPVILRADGVSLTGGPSLGGDQLADALRIQGGEGFRVETVYPVFSAGNGDYTVAGWVRVDDIQKQVIWSNQAVGNIASEEGYFRVLYLDENGAMCHAAYHPTRAVGDRISKTISSATALEPGQWYFVTVTHAIGKHKVLYLNGKEAGRSGDIQGNKLEVYSELNVGRSFDDFAPALSGAVSEMLLFNRDLSAKEIQQLYLSSSSDPG